MISICCPTRNRPECMRKLADSALSTSSGEIEILFRIDEDDKNSISIPFTKNIIGHRRKKLGICYNELYDVAKGDILMIAADDIVFKTSGWDRMVELAYRYSSDQVLVCYGDDGSPTGKTFSSHPFISRKMAETLGYLAIPFLSRYIDSWWFSIGESFDRLRFLPLSTTHWSKSENMKSDLDINANKDLETYHILLGDFFQFTKEKLSSVMENNSNMKFFN